MTISLYEFPNQADCQNVMNGQVHSDRLFTFNPTNAATRSEYFACVPGRLYRAVVRAGDDDNQFDIGQSDECCTCTAELVVATPSLSDIGLLILATTIVGAGIWALRRHRVGSRAT
jgi:hypothetical protein